MADWTLWPKGQFDHTLVQAAVKGGEKAVEQDERYPPPGEDRLRFWQEVFRVTTQGRHHPEPTTGGSTEG